MSETGPSQGLYRDSFHRNPALAVNGARVEGKWIAQEWRWDGVVRDFQHDGSWDFQLPPPGTGQGTDYPNYQWWSANGPSRAGFKTEHCSPVRRFRRLEYLIWDLGYI